MYIDINCDLGEEIGNDIAIMPLISSCNIACGVHAGSLETIKETIALAQKHRVKIGAHPSYPDRENFGRLRLNLSQEALKKTIYEQIRAVKKESDKQKAILHHVKPHGALYNEACVNKEIAQAIVVAIIAIDKKLVLYASYKSVLATVAKKAGLTVHYEAFMDRRYNSDLSLVSRKLPKATLSNPTEVCEQLLAIISVNKVLSIQGVDTIIKAQTFCIHGDNINAVAILKDVHQFCDNHKIKIC